MEQNYWQLGTWGRIPVAMHWTVLIVGVWLYFFFWSIPATLLAFAAYVALLVAHEYGHVFALRRRKIPVESISLYALHGRTSYGYASPGYSIVVAWAGVAAQLVILAVALVLRYTLDLHEYPLAAMAVSTILSIFIFGNLFLMAVALLPIGPFDGGAAWAAIPYLRAQLRRRKQRKREIELYPEKGLSPDKRRALEESSSKQAAELLEKFSKKADGRKEDA
jgi:Zn-dependent protease